MRVPFTIILSLLFLCSFCQEKYNIDSTVFKFNVENPDSPYFYQTKNFVISLSADEIQENEHLFKNKLYSSIRKNSFIQDTVWLNKYIKRNREIEMKLFCWNKIKNKTAYILNTDTNQKVNEILYVTYSDNSYFYYKYFDNNTGQIIFERKNVWIGTPAF